MTKENQHESVTSQAELNARGWGVSEAAKIIGCSQTSISLVLSGRMKSAPIIAALNALPKREPVISGARSSQARKARYLANIEKNLSKLG